MAIMNIFKLLTLTVYYRLIKIRANLKANRITIVLLLTFFVGDIFRIFANEGSLNGEGEGDGNGRLAFLRNFFGGKLDGVGEGDGDGEI